jgi:hypothetical protein
MTISVETLVLSIVSSTIAGAVLYLLLSIIRMRNEKKYDYDKQRSIIEMYRKNYEDKIYELEKKMLDSTERWNDINHLLISSMKNENSYEKNEKTFYSGFLKAAGLKNSDLQIDKKFVFILTPYNPRFESVYETIKKTCINVGLQCARGDEEYFKSDFLTHILKQIAKANFIVANIDGRSPNVYYELGIAHAIDKKTILITRSLQELPADLKSKRIVLYENRLDLSSKLKDEIIKILAD